jgi:hypothetical protein
MSPRDLDRLVILPVLDYLGSPFHAIKARVLLLAIAIQETDLATRDQGNPAVPGPARGFWQFERIAVEDFLRHGHKTTKQAAAAVWQPQTVESIWYALGTGADHLACVLARDRLWRMIPAPLPELGDANGAWDQYADAWRPGKPNPQRWLESYQRALRTVQREPI